MRSAGIGEIDEKKIAETTETKSTATTSSTTPPPAPPRAPSMGIGNQKPRASSGHGDIGVVPAPGMEDTRSETYLFLYFFISLFLERLSFSLLKTASLRHRRRISRTARGAVVRDSGFVVNVKGQQSIVAPSRVVERGRVEHTIGSISIRLRVSLFPSLKPAALAISRAVSEKWGMDLKRGAAHFVGIGPDSGAAPTRSRQHAHASPTAAAWGGCGA